MPTQSGFHRHLRGRIAFQANLSLPPAIPGRCPGIFTVQPSRLRCFLRLFDSQSLSLVLSLTLRLFVSLTLCLFLSLTLRLSMQGLCIVCVQFEAQTMHYATRGESVRCRVKCTVCVQFAEFFVSPFFTYSVEGGSVNHGTRSIPKQNVSTFF